MRRLLVALLAGAWVATLLALVLPLPIALAGGRIGTEAATPVFFGAWLMLSGALYAAGTALRMGVYALRSSAIILLVMALFAAWPPVDATLVGLAVGSAILALAQGWVAQRLLAAASAAGTRRGRQ